MAKVGRLRTGLSQRLGFYPSDLKRRWGQGRWPWLHAVSVGEAMAARSLLEPLRDTEFGERFMISTVTATGQEMVRKMSVPEDLCFYLPLDYSFMMNRIVRWARPTFLAVLETEIWPNLVRSVSRSGSPTLLVNGRISDKSFDNYVRLRSFFRDVLSCFACFGMQTQDDADRIVAMGADRDKVRVTGNVKFDSSLGGIPTADKIEAFRQELRLDGDRKVLVAGSTHPGEEEVLTHAALSLLHEMPHLVMIVTPRHLDRAEEVAELGRNAGLRTCRRSEGVERDAQWIVLDTMGELFIAYGTASVVFMGKSLFKRRSGGQNPIEPAALGKPILMGPFVSNFRSVVFQLQQGGGLVSLEEEGKDFVDKTKKLLLDPERCSQIGRKAKAVVENNAGAAHRTVSLICEKVLKEGTYKREGEGSETESPR